LKLERTIEIAAPPEKVWAVLSDIERWPRWTASMTSVERLDDGEFGPGSQARIRQPKLPVNVWRVTGFEPGRFFAWETSGPGFRTVAGHRVEPAGGGSRVTLSLEQGGILGALFALWFRKLTREYVDLEAQGLKRHGESPA
jgi:uncharacterized membrane protein